MHLVIHTNFFFLPVYWVKNWVLGSVVLVLEIAEFSNMFHWAVSVTLKFFSENCNHDKTMFKLLHFQQVYWMHKLICICICLYIFPVLLGPGCSLGSYVMIPFLCAFVQDMFVLALFFSISRSNNMSLLIQMSAIYQTMYESYLVWTWHSCCLLDGFSWEWVMVYNQKLVDVLDISLFLLFIFLLLQDVYWHMQETKDHEEFWCNWFRYVFFHI